LLWATLRERPGGFKFRRQHVVATYIVDFYCVAARLVIELDGSIHDQQAESDYDRQENLEALGLKVLRFKNEELITDLPAVLTTIIAASKERTPASAPPRLREERGLGGEV
jgi:very-short-patch-repair endonuclease